MVGPSHRDRRPSMSWSRRRLGVFAPLALAVAALGLIVGILPTATPVLADDGDADFCGGAITAETAPPKQINLVLDDSGSMFHQNRGTVLLDRWSKAKYSLEVFAALMGPSDTLKVFLLSDFDKAGDTRTPVVTLSGSQSRSQRAQAIRDVDFVGQRTPFLAVEEAAEDLEDSAVEDKWLVVITDGKFELARGESLEEADLNERTKVLVERTREQGNPIKVAYLAIGDDIPVLSEDRSLGIYSEQASNDQQLLLKMNDLADRVFGRDAENLPASGLWDFGSDSVDMEQMIVFAQGAGVQISPSASTANGTVAATDIVNVSWSENPDVKLEGRGIPARPDESLEGQVAFFENLPRGPVQFDITGARTDVPVRVFYKPLVTLGYKLFTESGESVQDVEPIAGNYTMEYGFMDRECNFVESPLLGDQRIEYVGVSQNGELIDEQFASGSSIEFPRGEVTIEILGTYLDGVQIVNPEPRERVFRQPPLPSDMQAQSVSYQVSDLTDFPPAGQQIPLEYSIVEDGITRVPTDEEWAQLDTTTFTYDHISNLEFDVVKGQNPGELSLLVRAPEGDVFAADTGDIDVTVRGSYLPDQSAGVAEVTVPIEVVDDLSFWERRWNDFKTWGWKVLLALLLLILLIGYLTKKRFSKRVKKRPSITGTPKSVGVTAIEDRGKFQAGGIKRFLPFVANTATLSYVPPGTVGFRAMKLKAGPGKSMIVTNWKEIAEKDNVEINGTPLNSETRRPPKLSASGTITASTPQMTYELTPSN